MVDLQGVDGRVPGPDGCSQGVGGCSLGWVVVSRVAPGVISSGVLSGSRGSLQGHPQGSLQGRPQEGLSKGVLGGLTQRGPVLLRQNGLNAKMVKTILYAKNNP